MTKKKLVTREDVCYVCGEPIGVIVYDDRKEKYRSKKNTVVCSGSLCPKCKKMVDYGGIFFIEVKDGSNGLEIRTELEGLSAFRNPMLRRFSKTTSR